MGGLRMTGLISGMDTEAMVNELVKASSTKVDKVKQDKQKLEWKKEAWSALNTKLTSFFKTELSNFKANASFKANKATVSTEGKVSVSAANNAPKGTHMVSVKQVASSAYLTGASIKNATTESGTAVTSGTKLTDLGIAEGTSFSIKGQEVVVDGNMSLKDLASKFSKMGVSANFDEKQGRFYINANGTGSENDFEVTSTDPSTLEKLGFGAGSKKIDAQDAIIEYNGVEYTNSSNTFELNGLSITAKAVTGEYDKETGVFKNDSPLTITVDTDTDAAYKTVKDFVNKYNELIDEMNKLYNEKKSTYDPLTDEEKKSLSETQVEQWEKKAKEGLLRRDDTLNDLLSNMRTILNKGIEVTDENGNVKRMSLASLGIVTGDYTENGKLHILGDEDDATYAGQENKLKKLLSQNANLVSEVIAGSSSKPGIGLQLYNKLSDSMRRIEGVRSTQTFFNDKTMDSDLKKYDQEIDKWAEKLQKMEDKYYKQFGAMESAMAEMQQQQTYISQLMGGM